MVFTPVGDSLTVFFGQPRMAFVHDVTERESVTTAPSPRTVMRVMVFQEETAVIMQFVNRHFASSIGLQSYGVGLMSLISQAYD